MMDLEKALEYMWNKYGITVMAILFVSFYAMSAVNYSKINKTPDLKCPESPSCVVK